MKQLFEVIDNYQFVDVGNMIMVNKAFAVLVIIAIFCVGFMSGRWRAE